MAHYAFLDLENVVTEVIVGKDENELIEGLDPETWYGNYRRQKCVRTSYNRTIRFNFAGKGFSYDEDRDAFIPPKCHDEASLDDLTCLWICTNGDHNELS